MKRNKTYEYINTLQYIPSHVQQEDGSKKVETFQIYFIKKAVKTIVN
jgi:hypothetical protein